jgi:hypothetical protein
MPASISTINLRIFLSFGGAISAIKIAVANPKGKAIIIAPITTKSVSTIIGKAPKSPFEGSQFVPKRNSFKGTAPKKGAPSMNKKIIIRNTKIVAIEAKKNNVHFMIGSLFFFK